MKFSNKTVYFWTVLVVVFLIIGSRFVVHTIVTQHNDEHLENMTTILETSYQAIKSWERTMKGVVKLWAGSPQTVKLTEDILRVPVIREELLAAPEQAQLRELFRPIILAHHFKGFFIIDRDCNNLASTRDNNVAIKNLLVEQTTFFEKIWSGESAISLPTITDVPLEADDGTLQEHIPTMFVGAPVKDSAGNIIAALTFRIDPSLDFTSLLQRGRLEETGETYAFNKEGLLISDSRFDSDLRKIGLIPQTGRGILSIPIRDPGVDLTKGNKSEIPIDQRKLTLMAQEAIAGKDSFNMKGYRDYRGIKVVGVWLWDKELSCGFTTELDFDEFIYDLSVIILMINVYTFIAVVFFISFNIFFIRSKKRIEKSEQDLRVTLASIGDGVVAVDTNGVIKQINRAASELTGWDRKKAIDQQFTSVVDLYNKDGNGQVVIDFSGFVANKNLVDLPDDILLKTKNGDMIRVSDSCEVVRTDSGEALGAVFVFRDNTERYELMQSLENERRLLEHRVENRTLELRKAKELAESANRAKSEFISNMSHEMRTPMNAVLGFSEILLSKEKDEKKKHFIELIQSSGKNLLVLIDNILTFSDLDSKKYDIINLPFQLVSLVEDISTLFETSANEKGLKIVTEVESDLNEKILSDYSLIHKILFQLIENAIKFTRNGSITIKADVYKDEIKQNILRIDVADTGIGIEEKKLQKIFNPFQQGSSDTNVLFGGTGLGLSIARNISELLGGTLTATSEPGTGSCFTLIIPNIQMIKETNRVVESPREGPSLQFKEASVLIVDDLAYNREFLSVFLEEYSFTLLYASNGKEALEQLYNNSVDLILLDMKMPVMDGYEFSKLVKADEKISSIPIVAITASVSEEDKRVIQQYCDGFIEKPIQTAELSSVIAKFLSL